MLQPSMPIKPQKIQELLPIRWARNAHRKGPDARPAIPADAYIDSLLESFPDFNECEITSDTAP